jgi:hypothetical protein
MQELEDALISAGYTTTYGPRVDPVLVALAWALDQINEDNLTAGQLAVFFAARATLKD